MYPEKYYGNKNIVIIAWLHQYTLTEVEIIGENIWWDWYKNFGKVWKEYKRSIKYIFN